MEYLLHKAKPADHFVARELRTVAQTLENAFEKLKQLALKASVRKTQLGMFHLASEIYKHYLEAVIHVQFLEKKLFCPFKIETYPDEFYVVSFNRQSKKDNTGEIFSECDNILLDLQKIYNDFISNPSVPQEQRKFLQQQLRGLFNCFFRLKANS